MTTARKSILLFLCFLISSLILQAEITASPFEEILPSQQTEMEIENMSENLIDVNAPQLRARPGDIDGSDQGQKVPLGNLGFMELVILTSLLALYLAISRRFRKNGRIMKTTLPLLFVVVGFSSMNAQIKAVPDNYFIEPGSSSLIYVVANDDPGNCSEFVGNLDLAIIANPAVGVTVDQNPDDPQELMITTASTAIGQYSFKYRITCKNNAALTSETAVYINVAKRPDFISDETCTIDMDSFVWDVKRDTISTQAIQPYATPLVGDIDGDGIPDIITANGALLRPNSPTLSRYLVSDSILIFDSMLNLKGSISVPPMDTYGGIAMAIADVDPVRNDGPEILIGTGKHFRQFPSYVPLVAGDAQRLYCYHYNTATGVYDLKWSSTERYLSVENATYAGESALIAVSDIDHDGLIEILIGDRIFSGGDESGNNGGRLLATLPDISAQLTDPEAGSGKAQRLHSSGTDVISSYAPTFADVDGDGIEEIIAGNVIYKISVNHSNPPLGTSIASRVMTAMPDGSVSTADLDGDGVLDIITVGRNTKASSVGTRIYGWKADGTILFEEYDSQMRNGSRAFVGDINGNGIIDLAISSALKLHAWEYDKNTGNLTKFIDKTTSDKSGMTTLTLFDFDNDGRAELVYRDETDLRIMRWNQIINDFNEITTPCFSGTAVEYPVVADIDNDGHAEIIVSGATESSKTTNDVKLWIFKSPTNSWAPARSVWHQHGYNPTQINKDLTVPRYPLSPATKVTRKDGSVHYPYNNFLQQYGELNLEGDPLQVAPDLAFVNRSQRMSYNSLTDVMTIQAYITNYGAVDFTGDLRISLYGIDTSTGTYKRIFSDDFNGEKLIQLQEESYTLTISGFNTLVQSAETGGFVVDQWLLTVNLNENGTSSPLAYYKNQKECIEWNNRTSRISYVTGDLLLCENETGTIKLSPSGIYDCYWYQVDAGGVKHPYPSAGNNKADQVLYTKIDDSTREFLLVQVHAKGSGTPVSNIMDSIFIYHPIDSLVWTGAVNSDWHNVNNWRSPSDPTNIAKHRHLPRSCTNVLIPSESQGVPITNFPDLSATGTEYATYDKAECNNITFAHGGEVKQVDLLTYAKSYIHVDVLSNRWYTFAPPLMNFYSGDIYKNKISPFDDTFIAYTRLFSQADPQHNSYVEGNWGRAFNTPTQTFSVGQGLGLWLDDFDPNERNKSIQSLVFPKHDPEYYLYDREAPHNIIDGPFAVSSRANSHRFIFEETINPTNNDVSLQVESKTAGKHILIANPYMSHIDFDKFYNYGNNKNLIQPHYAIMEDGYSYATYYLNNPGASTGVPTLGQYIAPMQSIIVETKVAIDPSTNPLITNGSMTTSQPGFSLRGVEKGIGGAEDFFKVSISDTRKRSKASLVINQQAGDNLNFDSHVDVSKTYTLLSQKTGPAYPTVYYITNDQEFVDIKAIPHVKEMTVRLGLQFTETGAMALGFENVSFFSGYYVYLRDKYENQLVELSDENPIYCFINNAEKEYVNDRFELVVSRAAQGIEEFIEADSPIFVKMDKNTLIVESKSGEPLGQTIVYSMQGVLIFSSNISHSSIMMTLNPGVYVLKNENYTTKIISE